MDGSNFIAFDVVRRREKFWDGVMLQRGSMRNLSSTSSTVTLPDKLKHLIFTSRIWSSLLLLSTLISVFSPSLWLRFCPPSSDIYFGIVYLILTAFFLADLSIHVYLDRRYLRSLAGLLDLVSIGAMLTESLVFLSDGRWVSAVYMVEFVDPFQGGESHLLLSPRALASFLTTLRVLCILRLGRLVRLSEWLGALLTARRASLQSHLVEEVVHRRLKLMFACMDEDNDGFISKRDFNHVLHYLSVQFEVPVLAHTQSAFFTNFNSVPPSHQTPSHVQTPTHGMIKTHGMYHTQSHLYPTVGLGRKGSNTSLDTESLHNVGFGDFRSMLMSSVVAKKLTESTAESMKTDTQTFAILAEITKRGVTQVLFGAITLLVSWTLMVQPEANFFGGSGFSMGVSMIDLYVYTQGVANIAPTNGALIRQTLSGGLCAGRDALMYLDLQNLEDADVEKIVDLEGLNRRSFEYGLIRPQGSDSVAVIDQQCILHREYEHQVYLSICAIVLLMVASLNFVKLVEFLLGTLVTPLKGLVDRMEQLGVFEYAAVGSHGVFGEKGGVAETEELDEVRKLKLSIDRVQSMISSWAKYCPYDVVQMVLYTGEEVALGVAPREVTVLFSDIEGFTTICEKLPPALVLKVLSSYFAMASDVISASGGTLLEFIGDGLLVCWNAPVNVKMHSQKALEACLEMQRQCALLSVTDEAWISALKQVRKTHLRVRMGLHAGRALCGNLGAANRMKYGILGDVINTASRLEELNKRYLTNIIISEAVYDAPNVRESFLVRVIDRVAVKGKDAGLTLFEVLGNIDGAHEYQVILSNLHEAAYKMYLAGSFVDAAKLLRRAEQVSKVAGISEQAASVLRIQAQNFAKHPPPIVDGKLAFDGTTKLSSKDGSN